MRAYPKLFCFDMDGTITDIASSWEHLSRELGIWDDRAEHHLTAFIKGEIDYMEFCRLDALVLKGLESKLIRRAIGKIDIDPGIERLAQLLKQQGAKLALVSSGLSILADRVMEVAPFDYVFVNELEEADGLMTGGVIVNVSIDNPAMTKKAIVSALAGQMKPIGRKSQL
jgi:phosphoserine phosphatase